MGSRPQKGKGSKRLRKYHRGRAEGRRAVPKIHALEVAEARAVDLEAELQEAAARGLEETELWLALAHVSPHVPELFPAWL